MSKGGWLRIRKEMAIVEQMLNTEHLKDRRTTDQIKLVARRLAVSDITAWRRLQRFNDYNKAKVLGDEDAVKRLEWHQI